MCEQVSNWLNNDKAKSMLKALNNLKASRVNDSIAKLNSNKDLALSLLTEASAINEVVSSLSNLDKTKKLLDIQN